MNKTTNKFSPEIRERAVRMVGEHRADYASEWTCPGKVKSRLFIRRHFAQTASD